jgi:hypothetical protein
MAPKPQVIEQRSQATPFTEKFMEQLMGNLSSGYATGLQQHAGTAIQQYVGSLKPYDMTDTFRGLEQMFANQNARATSDLREQYSMGGNRYGSASATGTGRFLAEAIPAQQYLMGKLGLEGYDIFNRMKLGGLGLQADNANAALEPFLRFALAGNHPDQIFMQENPWMTGLKTLGGLATGAGGFMTGLAGLRSPATAV